MALAGVDAESIRKFISGFGVGVLDQIIAQAKDQAGQEFSLKDGAGADAIKLAVKMGWNGPWGIKKPFMEAGTEVTVQSQVAKVVPGKFELDGVTPKYAISNHSWRMFCKGVMQILEELKGGWAVSCYYHQHIERTYGYKKALPWPLNEFDELPTEQARKQWFEDHKE